MKKTNKTNNNLNAAKREKNDEFYTNISDIERELYHYKDHFRGKTVFCNCDDPVESNFWRYFELNFDQFGLKTLISTHYNSNAQSYKLIRKRDVLDNDNGSGTIGTVSVPLSQNGDFRSPECIEILKEADIIVTNPPFSLFREYIAQLIEHDKKFIVLGNMNAITYKEIFPLIKNNQIWLGNYNVSKFRVSDDWDQKNTFIGEDGKKYASFGNICWFTNVPFEKRNEKLILTCNYTEEKYPSYDNYKAINVNKVADIPCDYAGVMGVPITFLTVYNPNQFEIIDSNDYRKNDSVPFKSHGLIKDKESAINGNPVYVRILIKRKQNN